MCGISGFVSNEGCKLYNLKSATDIISHRGPDDEGYVIFKNENNKPICLGGKSTPQEAFSSDLNYKPSESIRSFKNNKANIALGHRRLSILDLSTFGHQPMCSSDENLWIVFNGEIYNFIELRDELEKYGYNFITDTDTEVILAAYKEWGVECLTRFNGMWAFVIYDRTQNEIFMARDRFGIKPLYYWFNPNDDLYFGSEIKQFTVCDGWLAKMNSQRVYDYLIYSLTDHTDETMFEGVFHLPPGHYYKSKVQNIRPTSKRKLPVKQWYNINYYKRGLSISEAAAGFSSHFDRAVELHLRSDVSVGSALSGGLDSSAIVCQINQKLRDEGKAQLQKTFSSCAENEVYSEKKWMDIVVRETNVDAHFTYPEFDNLFNLTPKILWHQDEPYQSQSVYLGYHVFKLAQENDVKVLLNGQGADEYLGGYGQNSTAFRYKLLKSLQWKSLYQEYKHSKNGDFRGFMKEILKLSLPKFLKKRIKQISDTTGLEKLIDIDKLISEKKHPYDSIFYDSKSPNLKDIKDITQLHLFHNPLPRYLRWEDRNSMSQSIEARVPFLDYRLVEYTCNLPDNYIYADGETKVIMRRALNNILPEEIRKRQDKKGFITPEQEWVMKNPEIFRKKIKEAIEVTNGIIKPEAINYFDNLAKGNLQFDYFYWRMILFSEWVKVFNVKLN